MSRRTERIGNLIRAVLADAIHARLHDPRIAPLTSITRVEVAADFSVARVFVSVMASAAQQKLCVEALQGAAGRLRSFVATEVVMRQTPRLEFVLDESIQGAFRTVQAIDEAMAELGEPTTPPPADEPPGEEHEGS
ncbi:MAG: 30S ribosome-binding factor RbfA [Phycisphaerae bacterium]